jgi:iron-sulfur cluster assembly protein
MRNGSQFASTRRTPAGTSVVLRRNLALPFPPHEGIRIPARNERYECHKVPTGTRWDVRYHEPVATVEHPTDTLITLTPLAAAKIKELLAEEPDGNTLVLRVAIQGGGCSGFQYGLGFDAGAAEGDVELELEGVPVVVDPFSAPYLRGSTVDFLNAIEESGFKIDNPNATASCGCGHSFTVAEGEEPGDEAAQGCGPGCSH